MKVFARLALLLASASLLCAQGSVAQIDNEYGFIGARLNSPPEAYRETEQVDELGRWLTLKDNRHLSYATFKLEEVRYNFLWKKLYSIHIDVLGKKATRGVLAALLQQYGPPTSFESRTLVSEGVTLETREWKGKRVYMLYKSATNGKGGQIVVVDKANWDKMQAPREQMVNQNLKWMEGSFMKGEFDLGRDRK